MVRLIENLCQHQTNIIVVKLHKCILPRNEIELRLLKIWSEILMLHNISIDDIYFELGGIPYKLYDLLIKSIKSLVNALSVNSLFKEGSTMLD